MEIGLEAELFIGPKTVMHCVDKLFCPWVFIRLAGDLFFEDHM
jgi:hypothetical protein